VGYCWLDLFTQKVTVGRYSLKLAREDTTAVEGVEVGIGQEASDDKPAESK
jgi:hypothetical protein